ncbi:MAG: hypothetical protein KDA64_08945 [Rhodospirillaceae bacterium]|nr:hypothetical protein [Rhodospirillaceae bacterium]
MKFPDAMRDQRVFGPLFTPADSWLPWRAVMRAAFGQPLAEAERPIWDQVAGGREPPAEQVEELWCVAGRRGGKSRIAASLGVFMAAGMDWTPRLAPGEIATVALLAADREQARNLARYASGAVKSTPLISRMVTNETTDAIAFNNRTQVTVKTATFRGIRGFTFAAVIADELAFWFDDGANPDHEILDAVRPAMLPGGLLVGISSPYRRQGVLFETWRDCYGTDDPNTLVVQAPSLVMNPSLDPKIVERAEARDAAKAAAEFGAQFRTDIESYISRDVLDALVTPDLFERPPLPDTRYVAFVDPSGGSKDSMTLGIAHLEAGKAVLDLVRERRPPFSPEAVVTDFAAVLKSYRCGRVTGDRYGGEWPREQFRKHGIEYRVADKSKPAIYAETLPALNSGRVDLLDNKTLIRQLAALERRTARGGRDSIDHPPNGKDDVANAGAGAVLLALESVRHEHRLAAPSFVANPTWRSDGAHGAASVFSGDWQ